MYSVIFPIDVSHPALYSSLEVSHNDIQAGVRAEHIAHLSQHGSLVSAVSSPVFRDTVGSE